MTLSDDSTAHGPLDAGTLPELPPGSRYLIVHDAAGSRVMAIDDGAELVVGRSREAQLQVRDDRISRKHAVIRCDGRQLWVRDLGSRNATVVNGHMLRDAERALAPGDMISLGDTRIVAASASPARIELGTPDDFSGEVVVADPVMIQLLGQVRRVAETPLNVLVLGETGVGKEIVAEHIHRWSRRAAGPFVTVNCAALPESLFESLLFGHEKGAFTGADERQPGHFQAAHRGTLFFDEVGELPAAAQAKLLRVLESGQVTPLGSTKMRTVDVF
jgi:transcriptional regulator of acetoin/glycerol metabolism